MTRRANTSVTSVGNGLIAQAASRFITTLIPESVVSITNFLSFHSLEKPVFDVLGASGVPWLLFLAAYPCPYPGCLRTFNVSSNMRRHYRNHEFLANNRPQPQSTTLQTSFYSPPLPPDLYPPPPLQCGLR